VYTPPRARSRGEAQRQLGVEERSPVRTTLMVVGGVVVVAIVVFVLVTQVFGGSDDAATTTPNTVAPATSAATTPSGGGKKAKTTKSPAAARSSIDVAVLNGTGVPGLGASVSARIKGKGFTTGTPGDYNDVAATTTTVYFAEGQRGAADQVVRALGLPATSIKAMDPQVQAAAATAGDTSTDVIVVAGADQNTAQ